MDKFNEKLRELMNNLGSVVFHLASGKFDRVELLKVMRKARRTINYMITHLGG